MKTHFLQLSNATVKVTELCLPGHARTFLVHSAFMDFDVFAGNKVLPQIPKIYLTLEIATKIENNSLWGPFGFSPSDT